jgi:hypothetical protein
MNKKKADFLEKRKNLHHQYQKNPEPSDYLKDLEKFLKQKTRNKIRELYKNKVTEHEKKLIDDMLGVMTNPLDIAHFLMGAHIHLEGDNALLYKKWSKDFGPRTGVNGEAILGSRKNRVSSHYSEDQQYAISGPVVNEALFGTRYIDTKSASDAKYTWIQLENRPVGGINEFKSAPLTFITNIIFHMIDYFDYKITKRNIGPHGKSIYTEANPLRINVSNVTPELAAQRASIWKEVIFERLGDIRGLEDRMIMAGLEVPAGFKPIPTAIV